MIHPRISSEIIYLHVDTSLRFAYRLTNDVFLKICLIIIIIIIAIRYA